MNRLIKHMRDWRPRPLAELPGDVIRRGRYVLLDTIAAALGGRGETASVQLRELFSKEPSLSGLDNALLLGVAAHAADLDETNVSANCHIAAAVVPALWGMTFERDINGRVLLEALVAGYEVEALIGRALAPRHGQRGWHPSGTLGTFGAAAAVSHALGLDQHATWRALAIAATQASGVKAVFGSSAKPFNLGRAAQSGLLAARLAEIGMTLPGDPFEFMRGFFAAAGATPISIGSEPRHPILDNHFKFLPCCIETHAAAYGASKAVIGERMARRIQIVLAPSARMLVDQPAPSSLEEARFSVQYAVASALRETLVGVRPRPFEPLLLRDAPEISVTEDEALGHLGARVRVVGDKESEWIIVDLGAAGVLDALALDAKFDELASTSLGTDSACVRQTILDIDSLPSVEGVLGPLAHIVTMRDTEKSS